MATTSLNQFASSLLLVVMSFDRFLAVCHPIYAQRFRRLRRAKIICLCIWIACLVLMTPIVSDALAPASKLQTSASASALSLARSLNSNANSLTLSAKLNPAIGRPALDLQFAFAKTDKDMQTCAIFWPE